MLVLYRAAGVYAVFYGDLDFGLAAAARTIEGSALPMDGLSAILCSVANIPSSIPALLLIVLP